MRNQIYIILAAALVLAACSRIHEPWVKGDRLLQERTRSQAQTRALQDRFRRVQTDR